MSRTIYGLPSNTTFADVWDDAATFVAQYKACGLYDANNKISDASASNLYYLLYSRFGNDSIASRDTNRFKYAVWGIIFEFGPSWESKLELQNKVRNLTDAELIAGGKAIFNHAYNPGTAPSTSTLEELTAINDQNTTNYQKSKIEAYSLKWDMISNDVTKQFIDKFANLFSKVAAPVYQIAFPVEDEE